MRHVKGVLTMILIGTLVTSLFACAKQPEGKIVSVRFGGTSMSFADCFSFTLTEEDSKVLFSCDTQASDGERIELDQVSVDPAVMEDFRVRALKSGMKEAVLSYKKPLFRPFASDEQTRSYTLRWEDGTERTAAQNPPDAAEMRAFFVSVAERYRNGTVELPTGSLTACSISASASWAEGCYSFAAVHEKDGWKISADYCEVIQTAGGYWDNERIVLDNVPVSDETGEKICAAAEEVGLRVWLTSAENRWTPADDEIEFPLDASTFSVSAVWDDSDFLSYSGFGNPPENALLEALQDAAKEAAQSNQ